MNEAYHNVIATDDFLLYLLVKRSLHHAGSPNNAHGPLFVQYERRLLTCCFFAYDIVIHGVNATIDGLGSQKAKFDHICPDLIKRGQVVDTKCIYHPTRLYGRLIEGHAVPARSFGVRLVL